MISAVVITKNEEETITDCLKSLSWCDEIIIVDDFSNDKTLGVIKNLKLKTKIFKRRLNSDFAAQRNFGLEKAKGEWVFFVDADEKISPSLRDEIKQRTKNSRTDAFFLKRRDIFLGRELKHGENGNIKLLRLARKSSGKWKRKIHEYWNVSGETGELKNSIIHIKSENLKEFVDKINKYSTFHAEELKIEGKRGNVIKVIFWPSGKFIVNYFFRLGILDGKPGFIMASMMSLHSFLSWIKLWIG